jgi:hypothetical protein
MYEYRHLDTPWVCGPMMGELDALVELRILRTKLEQLHQTEEVAPLMSDQVTPNMSLIDEAAQDLRTRMAEQQKRMEADAFLEHRNILPASAINAAPMSLAKPVEVTRPMRLTVDNTVAGGATEKIDIFIPNDFDTSKWGILQRAAVAKLDPKSSWSKEALPTIINAIVYAEKNKLSFEEGDVYMVAGRLEKTAKARIKQAMQSGLVEYYNINTELGEKRTVPYRSGTLTGQIETHYMTTTVVVKLKAWKEPCSPYIATFDEWFNGSNPNWRERPRYMLELNALGHALERAARPSGVDSDEAPPV